MWYLRAVLAQFHYLNSLVAKWAIKQWLGLKFPCEICSTIILGKQSHFNDYRADPGAMNTEHQGSTSQRNISEGVSSKGVSCYCCIFRPMNISKPLQKKMVVWNLKKICRNLWLLTKKNYWTQKLGNTTPNRS